MGERKVMSLPLKAGSATLVIGTATGISSVIGAYFSKSEETTKQGKSLSELIEEKYDYILLSANDKWEEAWKKYSEDNVGREKGKDELKLPSWPSTDQNKLITELKEKCKSLSNKRGGAIGDDLYQKLTKYCSRGVTFKEQAAKEGLTIANKKGDTKLWENRQSRTSELHEDLQKIGVQVMGVPVNTGTIIKGCEKTEIRNKQDKEYKRIYPSYEKVCIKHKNDPK